MTTDDNNRPNILLVVTDQQRADMMSTAGNPHLETPAMDALAASGTRFNRAYCTNPVCSPSRTSLLTGRFPSAIGLSSNDDSHLDSIPDEITASGLGHPLREAGYDTAYAGKQGLPADMDPAALGFQTLTTDGRRGCADACSTYIKSHSEQPFFLVASFVNPHDICYLAILDAIQAVDGFDHHLNETAVTTLEKALERPDGIDADEFFASYAPPLPVNHEPQTDEPGAVDYLLDQRPFRRYAREEWSSERWREHRWAYCRLTELVDAQIGRVLHALTEAGVREDTVVIFTSDHGDMDGSHRLEHKTIMYEEAVRVPLIVEPPQADRDHTVNHDLISTGLDVFPTICDYAGVAPPDHVVGRSVRELVEPQAGSSTWRDHVRIESEVGDAIVTGRYKYVQYERGVNSEQLYDLEHDPGEMRNAISDPAVTETVANLRDRLSASRA